MSNSKFGVFSEFANWCLNKQIPSVETVRNSDKYKELDALLHADVATEVVDTAVSATKREVEEREIVVEDALTIGALSDKDLATIKESIRSFKLLTKTPDLFRKLVTQTLHKGLHAKLSDLNQQNTWTHWYPGAICAFETSYVFLAVQGVPKKDSSLLEFFVVSYETNSSFDEIMDKSAEWKLITTNGLEDLPSHSYLLLLNDKVGNYSSKLAKLTKEKLRMRKATN